MSELSYEWLYDQYITQNKTTKQISEEFKLSRDTIAHKLSAYGIKRGQSIGPFTNKDWLYDQYINLDKTQREIANECGVSQCVISKYCQRYNISKKDVVFTKEFLYTEHIVKHKSMLQIAKETNRNNTTVRKYMDLYHIPVWTCHDNTNEYIDNNDGSTSVNVYDAYGKYVGTFVIDSDQVAKIKQYKWIIVTDNIVPDKPKQRVATGSHPTMILGRFILNVDNDKFVDHIDNNPLNNRKSNLRVASRSQNQMNHDIQRNNTSGFTGVSYINNKNIWYVQMGFKRHHLHLGYYKNIYDAVYARFIAEKILFKKYRSDRNDDEIMKYIDKCRNKESIEKYIKTKIEKISMQKGFRDE